MIRLWTGVFLLATSWLIGTGYYHAPNWSVWAALLLTGCACVVAARRLATGASDNTTKRCELPLLFLPSGLLGLLCMLLLCLPIWVLPWPHRAAPFPTARLHFPLPEGHELDTLEVGDRRENVRPVVQHAQLRSQQRAELGSNVPRVAGREH